MEQSAVPTEAR